MRFAHLIFFWLKKHQSVSYFAIAKMKKEEKMNIKFLHPSRHWCSDTSSSCAQNRVHFWILYEIICCNKILILHYVHKDKHWHKKKKHFAIPKIARKRNEFVSRIINIWYILYERSNVLNKHCILMCLGCRMHSISHAILFSVEWCTDDYLLDVNAACTMYVSLSMECNGSEYMRLEWE